MHPSTSLAACLSVSSALGLVRWATLSGPLSARSINFARDHQVTLAVRGGGHNGPGLGTCDDGLVIDLSEMKGIRVDPAAHTVRVEGGCTWGDVDHAPMPSGWRSRMVLFPPPASAG